MHIRQPDSDEINDIVRQLGAVRPDANVGGLRIYFLVQQIAHFLDVPKKRWTKASGLSVSDINVVLILRRAGGDFTVRPTELHRQLLVTSGAMTKQIDKLARAGLVRRVPAKGDGRSVLVQLTERGHTLADATMNHSNLVLNAFEKHAGITASHRRKLVPLLQKLADAAKRASEVEGPAPRRGKRR